jgi:hypothetical protein
MPGGLELWLFGGGRPPEFDGDQPRFRAGQALGGYLRPVGVYSEEVQHRLEESGALSGLAVEWVELPFPSMQRWFQFRAEAELVDKLFRRLRAFAEVAEQGRSIDPAAADQPRDCKLSAFGLSPRTCAALQAVGLTSMGQLCQLSSEDLLGMRDCGETTLAEVREKLAASRLTLRGDNRGYVVLWGRLRQALGALESEGALRTSCPLDQILSKVYRRLVLYDGDHGELWPSEDRR